MLRRTLSPAVIGIVALLAAGARTVYGFDLTGNWAGTVKCRAQAQQAPATRIVFDALAEFSRSGTGFGMRLNGGTFVRDYGGLAIFDQKEPDKLGDAVFAACGTTDALSDATFNEVGQFRVLADLVHGRGRLRGTSTYTDAGDTMGTCTWRLKWTSTTDPGVPTSCN